MTDKLAPLVGKLAVKAALESGRREILRLYLSDSLSQKSVLPFLKLAGEREIPVTRIASSALTEISGAVNHGGVAAKAGIRILSERSEFLARMKHLPHPALVFAFENFHDAHNLGYALRCVEALGADAVLLTPKEWGAEDCVISQSSGGSYDRMMIAPLEEPESLFYDLEEIGIESILATAGAYRSFYDFDLRAPVLIAVGGEFQGFSEAMKRASRHTAHLPMSDSIPSFPAGHAAAILASEVSRQRRLGGEAGQLWTKRAGARMPVQKARQLRERWNRENL